MIKIISSNNYCTNRNNFLAYSDFSSLSGLLIFPSFLKKKVFVFGKLANYDIKSVSTSTLMKLNTPLKLGESST